jgi:oligopeptide transport system substrate-binding protein
MTLLLPGMARGHILALFAGFILLLAPLVLQAAAVDYAKQSITIALTQEPPSLDTVRATDIVSFFVIGHVQEGLVRFDQRGATAPAVASSWVVSDTTIDFTLRPEARWSDGSQVTAADFVYAWRLLVTPASAAAYASIMYPVKNAEKIQRGELPATALGVTALSATLLRVELERPCGYCVSLMAHGAFFPIKQSFREAQGTDYGVEAANLLYNGPFELSSWTHGASLLLVKNPDYWQRDKVHLNAINIAYITEDNRARLNLFRDGSIALARLGAETVADAAGQGLRLRTFATGGMSYLRFNVAPDRLLAEHKLRQAIQLIFDSDEFVNKVIGIPGYKPAYGFFPSWLPGAANTFANEYPLAKIMPDAVRARQLVDEVRALVGDRSLTLLTVASPTGAKIAEYLQGIIAKQLGLAVKVDQQTFKQYLVKAEQGDFDIALSSWYPDFNDVVTYADLFASWNANNRGHYASAEYDRVLGLLQSTSAPAERMAAAARLQTILQEDVPIIPMAETGSAYLQHPKLRGVARHVLGADPDYSRARVIE